MSELDRGELNAHDAAIEHATRYLEETARLRPGQRVTYGDIPGVVVRLYADGPTESSRMYEVRVRRGLICVAGSDLET